MNIVKVEREYRIPNGRNCGKCKAAQQIGRGHYVRFDGHCEIWICMLFQCVLPLDIYEKGRRSDYDHRVYYDTITFARKCEDCLKKYADTEAEHGTD